MTATPLKIRYYGDPCLRQKAERVKDVGPAERMLIQSMLVTMENAKGIGLAAPQVGINQRIFVVDAGQGPIVFINPEILKREGDLEVLEEGCLSIPDVTINVKRRQKVVVKYMDENGRVCQKEFSDLTARVIQHENDHLDGKMIVDYATLPKKLRIKKKLKDLENGIIPPPSKEEDSDDSNPER